MKYFIFALVLVTLIVPSPVLAVDKDFWNDFSDSVFEQAKLKHKMVILDLHAVWCHWCHVMDEKTYKNKQVSALLEAQFLGVQVDQDSRPDISNKYQDYGWPATIFFDSNAHEILKKSGYIEPKEMIQILTKLSKNPDAYKNELDGEPAALKPVSQHLSPDKIKSIEKQINGQYDHKNGSWNTQHKFIDANQIEFFLRRTQMGPSPYTPFIKQSLDGALHLVDPVWGGIYQYSAGSNWHEPHFEKIMATQLDSARSFAWAYSLDGNIGYLTAAKEIAHFVNTTLKTSDGSFYTSQDADVILGKESSFYFKLDDAKRKTLGLPKVDTNIYSRENGWAIQINLELFAATGDAIYLEQAVQTARWVDSHRRSADGGFSHGPSDKSGPFLSDNIAMLKAFLQLYVASTNREWLARAELLLKYIDKTFRTTTGYNSDISQSKFIKSSPSPDENIQLGRTALMLFYYTGETAFQKIAENAYAGGVSRGALEDYYLLTVALALGEELESSPLHVTVIGPKTDPAARTLFQDALKLPSSYKRLDWWDKAEGPLRHADVSYPNLKKSAAFVCSKNRCSLPAYTAKDLKDRIKTF